jgi:hypothetical protein
MRAVLPLDLLTASGEDVALPGDQGVQLGR